MKTHLRSVELKTGETMDILRITAPDPEFRDRILAYLAHKGRPWMAPMELNLQADLEGLSQHFYLGVIGDEIVGNATSIEALERPVGILQHVFTPPERRRQGICSAIIQSYAQDFDARGGRAAWLHTGHDSAAYHIYASVGFVGWLDTGIMERLPDPSFSEDFWAPRPVTVRDAKWSDWAALEALYESVDGWYLRGIYHRQWGRSGYEGQYAHNREVMAQGRLTEEKVAQAANGAVVGHAFIVRDPFFHGDTWLLDLFLHPHYYGEGAALLAAMDLEPGAKVQAYSEPSQPEKAALLEGAGFAPEATLRAQVRKGDEWLDLTVWCR